MTWNVRPFRSEDRGSLVRTIDEVCGEGRWMRTARFEPTPAWRHALEQPACGGHLLLVAEAQGDVVGWCRLFPALCQDQGPAGAETESDRRQGVELGIGLLPAFRGLGAGRELVERSLAWARAAGLPAVHLTTRHTNTSALGLFTRCGFVLAGWPGGERVAMRYTVELAHEVDRPRGRGLDDNGAT